MKVRRRIFWVTTGEAEPVESLKRARVMGRTAVPVPLGSKEGSPVGTLMLQAWRPVSVRPRSWSMD